MAVMLSAAMGDFFTTGHRSADVLQDHEPLPTLLSSNANNVNGSVLKVETDSKSSRFVSKKQSQLPGGNISKLLAASKGSAFGPAQTITVENATPDSAEKKEEEKQADADAKIQSFVDGARVEYYSQSYREWVPAIIGDVRPNGCLKLLDDDGSVIKKEADPKNVRLAKEQAKFETSFSDSIFAVRSQAASGIKETQAGQSCNEALDSKEAYDQQMKLLHSRSEKCAAQLKCHRGFSEGMTHDHHLEFSHLEFRHSLSKATGPDMANAMQSSDELMRQMKFRHGMSSMYDQQLKLDRSLSEGMGSQVM